LDFATILEIHKEANAFFWILCSFGGGSDFGYVCPRAMPQIRIRKGGYAPDFRRLSKSGTAYLEVGYCHVLCGASQRQDQKASCGTAN
jgi:hypothetical protein